MASVVEGDKECCPHAWWILFPRVIWTEPQNGLKHRNEVASDSPLCLHLLTWPKDSLLAQFCFANSLCPVEIITAALPVCFYVGGFACKRHNENCFQFISKIIGDLSLSPPTHLQSSSSVLVSRPAGHPWRPLFPTAFLPSVTIQA